MHASTAASRVISEAPVRRGIAMIETVEDDVLAIRAMAIGQRDALTTLYERYCGLAYAFALRSVGDPASADEIVQDTFIALWRSAATFREDGCSPRSWIMTIVRNRAIDEIRRRRREPHRGEIDLNQPSSIADDPWPEAWKSHCSEAIRGALDELVPEQRQVVELGRRHVALRGARLPLSAP